jgi:hypothetical protein
MNTVLDSKRHHQLARASVFLIMVALITGMVGCGGEGTPMYNLTISSTEGGSVTTPGEDTYTYDAGQVVNLVAEADEDYRFRNWSGDVESIDDVNAASTTISMNDNCSITANFIAQYALTIDSTDGGEVTTPGEGTFTYDAGVVVDLVAEADEGYRFVNWTGDVDTVVYAASAFATIAMNADCSVTANFEVLDPERLFAGGSGTEEDPYRLKDWHELTNVRHFLGAHYRLMNSIDSTSPGYAEVASPTANQGKGWVPIGVAYIDPISGEGTRPTAPFAGSFDGQGYEIGDLLVYRPDEDAVGFFGCVDCGGAVENLRIMSAEVSGHRSVGGLVGVNYGSLNGSYCDHSVTGAERVGGIVGDNWGIVHGSSNEGSVVAEGSIGGLAGRNRGTVSGSYSVCEVSGSSTAGGLVGWNHGGTVSNSYFGGGVAVAGYCCIGGLVGHNDNGTVSNSHYNYDNVLINGNNVITIGALFDEDFNQWLANDKFLDVNERLSREQDDYVIENVSDFRQLLAFGQDASLIFELRGDLDLVGEREFFIPYLAGEFHGNGHKVVNLSFDFDPASQVGLFGYLAPDGKVSDLGVENVNITGRENLGGLVGWNAGTVTNSYTTGSVTGESEIGGVVGRNLGVMRDSYFKGALTGHYSVGGVSGANFATISNSHYNYDEVVISGQNIITVGALFGDDFNQWLANGRFLDVNERLSQEEGYYMIKDVPDFRQLLGFGQDDSLRFRLQDDLDLSTEPGFYVPYLAGEFDGSGHKISNLSFNSHLVSSVGLFGYVASDGRVTQLGVQSVNITGTGHVGGLAGCNMGTVLMCYSTGMVTGGDNRIGGLVGLNRGTVTNSHSAVTVTGGGLAGGLVGWNYAGAVTNSYSTGRVTGGSAVGGLVGQSGGAAVNSFWDTQTSGQSTSAGGTGKTTAEMKNLATFSDAAWNITAVADPDIRNPLYTWNIVDGQTYPFLSWEPVS